MSELVDAKALDRVGGGAPPPLSSVSLMLGVVPEGLGGLGAPQTTTVGLAAVVVNHYNSYTGLLLPLCSRHTHTYCNLMI